jgi:hypothetical protein
MSESRLKIPVALIIFNRSGTTAKVFEAIRRAKPPKLFVIADGARVGREGEAEKCAAARAIVDRVDWDCEVFKNYSEVNLGCGLRPASGISWVFEHAPEAIILEDDCLPAPSFFRFCEQMLEHYRDDERVMHVSGTNLLFGRGRRDYSYFFSRYPFCWGWATWRRAWRHFDYDLKRWPEVRAGDWLASALDDRSVAKFWTQQFDDVYAAGKRHIWDFQWIFACWIQRGLSVIPRVNLVSNIGFGDDATHTMNAGDVIAAALGKSRIANVSGLTKPVELAMRMKPLASLYARLARSRFSALPVEEMAFPLAHPPFVMRDAAADAYLQRHNYEGGRFAGVRRMVKRFLLR